MKKMLFLCVSLSALLTQSWSHGRNDNSGDELYAGERPIVTFIYSSNIDYNLNPVSFDGNQGYYGYDYSGGYSSGFQDGIENGIPTSRLNSVFVGENQNGYSGGYSSGFQDGTENGIPTSRLNSVFVGENQNGYSGGYSSGYNDGYRPENNLTSIRRELTDDEKKSAQSLRWW